MENVRFDPKKWDDMMNDKIEKLNQKISKKYGVPIELVRLHADFLKYKLYGQILSK